MKILNHGIYAIDAFGCGCDVDCSDCSDCGDCGDCAPVGYYGEDLG